MSCLFGFGSGQPFNQAPREIGGVQGRAFYHCAELDRMLAADP